MCTNTGGQHGRRSVDASQAFPAREERARSPKHPAGVRYPFTKSSGPVAERATTHLPLDSSTATSRQREATTGGRLGTPRRWPHNLSRRTVATGAMLDQFRPDVQGNSPFIVGVSGHRDLDPAELPRLKDAVAAFVTQLKSYLPDTEVHMVVGMAPGADLLVVETALDLNVQAVLPMSLDQYAADFEPDTLQHLKELLRHPRVHCVELRADAQESREVAPLSSVDARNAM